MRQGREVVRQESGKGAGEEGGGGLLRSPARPAISDATAQNMRIMRVTSWQASHTYAQNFL